jgi:hypothetical protein
VTEAIGQLGCDVIDELAAADLHQLGHSARHHRQILARLDGLSRERTAIEDPVRIRAEQRGQRCAEKPPVEQAVDADDRRRVEIGLRSPSRRADSAGGVATIASASMSSSESTRTPLNVYRRVRVSACGIAVHRAERFAKHSSPAASRGAVCTIKIPIAALASAEEGSGLVG